MSVKMKFGKKDIPFVYKGDKLVYPNPIKDGLLLWYDFKGMRNTDTNKEVAKDLSGNGNDGTLTNFNFTEGSGYKDNTLVFDGVDDSLTIPELVLDETAMTVVQGGKIYSYEDDKVLAIKDYSDKELTYLESLRAEGRNLIRGSEFKEQTSYYTYQRTDVEYLDGTLIATNHMGTLTTYPRIFYRPLGDLIVGEEYTISFKARGNTDFTASFWVSDANGGKSQLPSQNVSYTKEWKSYTFTFTANENLSDSTAIQWWVNNTNPDTIQSLFLKEIQLEKGVTATDWSPAPEDVREELPGIEVGGRNLVSLDDISKFGGLVIQHGFTFNLSASSSGGLKIDRDLFIPDTNYVFSYKIKVIDGIVYRLGGHSNGKSQIKMMLDGEQVYGNHVQGVNVELSEGWHTFEFHFYYSGDTVDHLYIQPNRSSFLEAYEVEIKDIQLEEGTIRTGWTPAPEDFQTTSLSPSSLSNLQLYNRPLRKDEIFHNVESDGLKELVDGVVVQDGLMLHYDFSHESNISEYKDKAFDYSGNGNHGTLENFNFTPESGYNGNKLLFDGVDDAVSVTGLPRNSSFSIFFSAGYTLDEDVLFFDFSNSNTYLRLINSETRSRLYFFAQSNDGTSNYYNGVYSSDLSYKANEMVFMGVVVIKDLVILYADGIEVGRGNLTAEILPVTLGGIGRWNSQYSSQNFKSVYYYNRPLTPEEVTHNYAIEKEKFSITEGEI